MIDDEIVSVDITAATATAEKQSFNKGIFACYHTKNTDLLRTYKSLSALTADGFSTTHPAYRALASWLQQEPRPKAGLKIGRLAHAVAHTEVITILSATEGDHIKLTIVDEDGNSTAIDYTVLAGATTTTVATAVELLVEAVTGIASTSSGADITAVGTSGKMFWYEGLLNCSIKETTPDASVATDLQAISAVDDDWYGVATPYGGATNIEAIAAYIETVPKYYFADTSDTEETTSGGVIGAALKSSGYTKTELTYRRKTKGMFCAGLMSVALARQPGSYTAKFKTVKGAEADDLNPTEIGYLDGDNINHYTSAYTGGISMFREGKAASGRFIDSVIGQAWLTARIKEAVFGAFQANDKLPQDNDGLAAIGAKVKGVLKEGVRVKYLRKSPPPAVFVPDIDDIPEDDRTERLASGITFSAREAGAVHKAQIQGSVT